MKIVSIISIFLLISCKSSDVGTKGLNNAVVENCKGKTVEITLPEGWKSRDRFEYEEGFIESFSYEDKMYVAVLCGGNAELNSPNSKLNYRRVEINGITVLYANVKDENISDFDRAFNLMLSDSRQCLTTYIIHGYASA